MLHFEKTFRYCSYKFCLENTFRCHTNKLRNDHEKCRKNRILQNFAKENNFEKFTAKKLYRL